MPLRTTSGGERFVPPTMASENNWRSALFSGWSSQSNVARVSLVKWRLVSFERVGEVRIEHGIGEERGGFEDLIRTTTFHVDKLEIMDGRGLHTSKI